MASMSRFHGGYDDGNGFDRYEEGDFDDVSRGDEDCESSSEWEGSMEATLYGYCKVTSVVRLITDDDHDIYVKYKQDRSIVEFNDPDGKELAHYNAAIQILHKLKDAEVLAVSLNQWERTGRYCNSAVYACSKEKFEKLTKSARKTKPVFVHQSATATYKHLPGDDPLMNAMWKNVFFIECSAVHELMTIVETPYSAGTIE